MADLRLRVLAGIVVAGLALGVAELFAAVLGADSAPLHALGAAVVDHTPDRVREWAITTFGTGDKSVLFASMSVAAVVIAGFAGAIERTTRAAGSALLAAFGVIAAAAAAARTGSLAGAVPTAIGVTAGLCAMRVLTRRIDAAASAGSAPQGTAGTTPVNAAPTGPGAGARSIETATESADRTDNDDTDESSSAAAQPVSTAEPAATARMGAHIRTDDVAPQHTSVSTPERRQVLRGVALTAGLAVIAGVGGRLWGGQRRNVSGERAAVQLPQPSGPTTSLGPEADLRVPGLTPYLTSNADFYRIDTALIVPQVSIDDWSLRIHGMVDREIRLGWADLANRQPVERLVTLACVSNPVGGDLIGNARWLGYRLDELLAEAGPHPDADMVLSHSVDGWTAGSPLSVLTDGRDALLAVGMNGEPLPVSHGYPARLVVPGLYGYVSATKWVTELEITRFDRATAYWTRRGWSAFGPTKTGTRIDTPRSRARLRPGRVPIAGVSWAQHRGITAVEVHIDDGPWQPARLATDQSIDTWRQWVYDWDAASGPHTIRARATDGTGEIQTAERRDVVPDGATGHPSVTVQVG